MMCFLSTPVNILKRGKRQNILREEDIEKIVTPINIVKKKIGIPVVFRWKKLRENAYNLNISRYVSIAKEEEKIDLHAVNEQLIGIEEKINEAREKHNKFLKELGLPLI